MYRIKLILCKIKDSVASHSLDKNLTKQSPSQILRAIHYSVQPLVVTEPSTLFIKYFRLVMRNYKAES